MLGITLASTPGNYYKACSQEMGNHFTGKRRHPLYPQASSINTYAPFRETDKPIKQRTATWHSLIPFKGSINALKGNNIKKTSKIDPVCVSENTAVVTINRKHSGVLMGGYDQSLTPQEKSEHVMLWGTNHNKIGAMKKLSEKKLEISLGLGLYYTFLFILKPHIPRYLVAPTSYTATLMIFKMLGFEDPVKLSLETFMLQGVSGDTIKESTFKAIPIMGINTSSMRKRALEIKQMGEYHYLTKNCSWAVLECLKAGLAQEVVEKLPSTGLYNTPTDVKKIITFLVDNGYVISGEVDEDGVPWFGDQTEPD